MADESAESAGRQSVNKPGTSCLGCRRRKLKCTREPNGCKNCTKSELPCVYPTPEVGVKRKRGPYKKDKPPRQRHLEDLVKYLEPKNSVSAGAEQHDSAGSGHEGSPGSEGTPAGSSRPTNGGPFAQVANSEDLVKDALIALTKSCVTENDSRLEDGSFFSHKTASGVRGPVPSFQHPPIRHIMELWHLFITRVDPVTKVFHAPTLGKQLFSVLDHLETISISTNAMLFSVYHSAMSTCTAREARTRFGESHDVLLKRYGGAVESAVSDNYDIPVLESLQALVLYIICLRRMDDGTNVRALFSLAVRSAQIIGVHEDPEGRYSPYETQMRRRIWYHLYGLEHRTAEDGAIRGTSIMKGSHVRLPENLNDRDVNTRMTTTPQPRAGVTDMTFVLLRYEIHQIMFSLWKIRLEKSSWQQESLADSPEIREEQHIFLKDQKARLQSRYNVHLDVSRPYDWLCLMFVQGMLIKARLAIDHPFGTVPTKQMPVDVRMNLLRASVDIIKGMHELAAEERIEDWHWYFRGYNQWHCLAIVVAEMGWSKNTEFLETAWQVLDPILADWDKMYSIKREEPAWDHVNALIERARHSRRVRIVQGKGNRRKSRDKPHQSCGSPINANAIMPFHVNASEYPSYHADAGVAPYPATTPHTNSTQTPAENGSGPSSSATEMDANMTYDYSPPGPFDDLENIDFEAFDHVFGTSWNDIGSEMEYFAQCEKRFDQFESQR